MGPLVKLIANAEKSTFRTQGLIVFLFSDKYYNVFFLNLTWLDAKRNLTYNR